MGRAFRLLAYLAAALVLPLTIAMPASAQTCGTDYVIQEGDSLAKIAGKVYGKTSQWTVIFYANQDRLGGGSSLIVPGLAVRIPCIGGTEAALPAAATTEAAAPAPAKIETAAITKKIQFLTADDYAPFTGRSLPDGGMHPNLITTAMNELKTESGGKVDFAINWVNDWSAHLNPLLVTRAFDMGFPWYQPDCKDFANLNDDSKYRCQKFFFSDPVYEELSLLFVKNESPIKFENDQEIPGRSLCRPAGYFSFDLDQNGRNWLKEKKITLLQPQTIEECFKLLMDGSADAVAVTELTGRAAVIKADLADKVRVIERPVGILADHIIIAKTHPNARVLLHYVNAAMAKLKADGKFDEIVEKHLTLFWESQTNDKPAAPAATEPSADATSGETAPATDTATTTDTTTATTSQ